MQEIKQMESKREDLASVANSCNKFSTFDRL